MAHPTEKIFVFCYNIELEFAKLGKIQGEKQQETQPDHMMQVQDSNSGQTGAERALSNKSSLHFT